LVLCSEIQTAIRPIQCIVKGEENPQNCPFPLGLRHPTGGGPIHGYRKHAQNNSVKTTRVVRDICSWTHRQTHIRARYNSSAGKVITRRPLSSEYRQAQHSYEHRRTPPDR